MRCKWCPNSKYERGLLKNKKLIDINLFKKIIDELSEINYKESIHLYFFGEPLSDKRLPKLISYTRKKLPKVKIQINSNGILLNVLLYKKLCESGLDIFHISQYTSKMPKNMEEVFKYLKTRPKSENKIKYRIFTEDLALSNRGGNVKTKKIWDKPICTYPKAMLNIDYGGNVILCCNDYHSSIKFGNLKNERLLNIWYKPEYKKLRRDLKKGIFKLPICKRCVGKE